MEFGKVILSRQNFTVIVENVMRRLQWNSMGVKIDVCQSNRHRFVDDIVLIAASISQAEQMLVDFDSTC